MLHRVFSAILMMALTESAFGQFTPALLQNRSYWGDGKSEIDFYEAEFRRNNQVHQSDLVVILTPVFVDSLTLAPIAGDTPPNAVPAIRMHEVTSISRGLTMENRAIDALWRMDTMFLARLCFVGNDEFGNISKSVRETRDQKAVTRTYRSESYTGAADGQISLGPQLVVAYDELPLRIRTVDFSKPTGEFTVDVAPTITSAEKSFGAAKPSTIRWKAGERAIEVEMVHTGGSDHFTLDASFPFLLRDWRAADGSHWRMKNSIRADPRKYLRNGDRERALKDPMLRHPD